MVGMGVKRLVDSEKEAQTDYSAAEKAARKKKDKVASKTFSHIRAEEAEHESMLKRLGER
jgi:rubrerythrin